MLGRTHTSNNPRSQWTGIIGIASVIFGAMVLLSLDHNRRHSMLGQIVQSTDVYRDDLSRLRAKTEEGGEMPQAWMLKEKEKVNVKVYFESLCPGCREFIIGPLKEAVEDKQLSSIFSLKMVPYGNAAVAKNETIICQHGAKECEGNKWEACAIHHYPETSEYFPFIDCVEQKNKEAFTVGWESVVQYCASPHKVDKTTLKRCMQSGEADRLIEEARKATPAHKYVPWVLINGQLADLDKDFSKQICNAYNGARKPKKCHHASTSLYDETLKEAV